VLCRQARAWDSAGRDGLNAPERNNLSQYRWRANLTLLASASHRAARPYSSFETMDFRHQRIAAHYERPAANQASALYGQNVLCARRHLDASDATVIAVEPVCSCMVNATFWQRAAKLYLLSVFRWAPQQQRPRNRVRRVVRFDAKPCLRCASMIDLTIASPQPQAPSPSRCARRIAAVEGD